ncbi:MAG: LysM peptidoglycan-binding domain-containing protein [Gemmatimonadaceae bacterium]
MRDVRNQQRGTLIRAVACAAFVIGACPQMLIAQDAKSSLPATHTVKRGDTLWDIAKLYFGDSYLWPEIYRDNTDIIEDPHWIYPGEILKLPAGTAHVIAVAPPAPAMPEAMPGPPTNIPAAFAEPAPPPPPRQTILDAPRSLVRMGEYAASPWVDQRGGPKGAGVIMQAGELEGIASADHSRMHLFDKVFFTPPVGAVAPERELYLSYRLGPMIEDFGQIVIPTGVVEVTRSPRDGEAVTGRVVKMFGTVNQGQFLVPYDTTGGVVAGRPSPVMNGRAGKIRWMNNEPVLPNMQNYVIVDIASRDGVRTGDQIELFQPRQKPVEGRSLIIPEVPIGRAQILRVTPYGATAIVTNVDQPKVSDGTSVRVAAKMP